MKKATLYLTFFVIGLMVTALAQAGKPGSGSDSGTVFLATFSGVSGELDGSGLSNPTKDKGKIANLVFNKVQSEVEFVIDVQSACDGSYGTPDVLDTTMQLYDGLGVNANMVARLYFSTVDSRYKLELFEAQGSPFGWDGGEFPPFAGGTITRLAGSWTIESLKGSPTGPCDGASGVFTSPVEFTLSPQ